MSRSLTLERKLKSPNYLIGKGDGEQDRRRVENCPPLQAIGPQPETLEHPEWPAMYNYGYEDAFSKAVPHVCTERCRRR